MIHSLISKSLHSLHWFVCACVSYHFWGHPGNHIMDSLPKDAQGGENEHNPKDHTCSGNTQTESSMLGVSFSHCDPFATPAMRKLHRVETKQSAKQADRNSSHTSSQFLFLYLLFSCCSYNPNKCLQYPHMNSNKWYWQWPLAVWPPRKGFYQPLWNIKGSASKCKGKSTGASILFNHAKYWTQFHRLMIQLLTWDSVRHSAWCTMLQQ